MKKLQINIFTTDLVWVGAIDAIESLIHRTSWHEIPSSELVISKHAQGVEELQVGRILLVNNQKDKALIIEDMAAALDSEYISFSLLSLKGLMNYRICHPTYANNFIQKRQSEVMQVLAYNNLINQSSDNDRKFYDSTNTKNMLVFTELKQFGDTIDFTVDWKTGFLGDAIVSVAKMYGVNTTAPLGWNVIVNSTNTSFILDVYHGTHKHINQTEYSPVIFSEEFGNIQNATYEYSIKEWRNAAYVSWTEEITDAEGKKENVQRVNWVGDGSKGITRSFNRKEVLLQSSKKTSAEVDAEGRSELNKRPHIETFTAEIIDTDKTLSTYGADWQLGDIVTVQSKSILKDRLISIDAQITAIEEIYSEGQYSINATFGEGRLSVFQLIKQSIEQKK
jgi:hypothetical protein